MFFVGMYKGSLFWLMNYIVIFMGGCLLCYWVSYLLCLKFVIEGRLDVVDALRELMLFEEGLMMDYDKVSYNMFNGLKI